MCRAAARWHELGRCLLRSTPSRIGLDIASANSIRSRHGGPAGCIRSQPPKPVKDMAAQRVPRWQPRMFEIEILCRVAGHPELFHDPPRCPVRRYREGDDLVETEPAKSVVDRGPRRLIGITPSPIRTG